MRDNKMASRNAGGGVGDVGLFFVADVMMFASPGSP